MLQDRTTRTRRHRAGVAGRAVEADPTDAVPDPAAPRPARRRRPAAARAAGSPSSPVASSSSARRPSLAPPPAGRPCRRRRARPARPAPPPACALLGTAIDPHRRAAAPAASIPAYDAMEAYFAAAGATAASRPGDDDQHRRAAGQPRHRRRPRRRRPAGGGCCTRSARRWSRRSPTPPCTPAGDTGWKSARQRVWQRLDRRPHRRCRPAPTRRRAWARYALDARVMLRRRDGDDWTRGARAAPSATGSTSDARAESRRPRRAPDHAVPAGAAARLVRGALRSTRSRGSGGRCRWRC